MTRITVALALLSIAALAACAQQRNPSYLSAKDAPKDFLIQGEYAGEVRVEEGAEKGGAQIMSMGDGNFIATFYPGGLPGAGFNTSKEKRFGSAQLQNDTLTFVVDEYTVTLRDGLITVTTAAGREIGSLKKVDRASPTLGAKPPQGAIVLFDGAGTDRWAQGKMSEDKLLVQGATTKDQFASCSLHLEFILPFEPLNRGQARANSGVYLQGRYEVQILDSFGLSGRNNEAGGIYEISDPKLNMCFPPLTWQTYDIEFTAAQYDNSGKTKNARMTVKHNGIIVQDNVEVPRGTRAAPVAEGPTPGPLHLQDHGNPIRFRNIWIVPK